MLDVMLRSAGMMPMPVSHAACPPGLEYLTQINQLLVKQKVELLEAMVGFEGANKYTIKNSMGQKVYYAKEGSCVLACFRVCLHLLGLTLVCIDTHFG
jgi:hypothetical protein